MAVLDEERLSSEDSERNLESSGRALDDIVITGVYKVRFESETEFIGPDMLPNPRVRIYSRRSNDYFFGYLVYSTKENKMYGSNQVRKYLVKYANDAERVKARVIGLPKDGNRHGPFALVGYSDYKILNFSEKEAWSVLTGDHVFYARFVGTGRRGSPSLIAYDTHGKELFGFLDKAPLARKDSDLSIGIRNFAENIISEQILAEINMGDCILVRPIKKEKIVRKSDGKLLDNYFFSPIINFREEHRGFSPKGKRLLTQVIDRKTHRPKTEHYMAGDFILDLPITSVEQTENKGLVGRGHVPRPAEDMSKTFFYKGVRVIDASDDLHKYVSRAEIIETNDNGLTALKIE